MSPLLRRALLIRFWRPVVHEDKTARWLAAACMKFGVSDFGRALAKTVEIRERRRAPKR